MPYRIYFTADMELTPDIKECVRESVLCWLATVSTDLVPSVSPKEIFHHYGANHIIIANIASPQSVRNIKANENVCVSFIDILVQKGYQIKGKAQIMGKTDADYADMAAVLDTMTKGEFPYATITRIKVENIKQIIAPKYILYPDTTEAEQIESARQAYGL